MSEVLEVAKALSRSDDAELERVIGIRLMPSSTFNDFFDFASALIKPQNMKGAVAGLTRNQILAFNNLLEGKSTKKDEPSLEVLSKLFLVIKKENKYQVLESAEFYFRQLVSPKLLSELTKELEIDAKETQYFAHVDPLAGIGAFETIQGLTELVIEFEQRYVQEVGRGRVANAELKRLAHFLGKDSEYAQALYSLAQMAGLIVLNQKRWRVGANYKKWLASTTEERWLSLATNWLRLIGPESAQELASKTDLRQAIEETFPLANEGITSHMSKLVSLAELIGLTAGSRASSWYRPLLQGDYVTAQKLIVKVLPKVQNKLIVQADLTLISTGPLDTETELMVRRFAEIERIGVASTYRISALTLSYGMETGLSADQIRAVLKELSGKDLPQPVEYLLKETANRFGRLTLTIHEDGTKIFSKDAVLLTAIANDSELKALGLVSLDEQNLFTRFEQEIVYYQLRENNYAAIALDQKGKTITNWFSGDGDYENPSQSLSVLSDIQRWREHDKRLGENPGGDDITRSLELAIKNKAEIKVTISDKKLNREFTLLPIGLANGRLRAKDRKADCERVLPLANIVSVVIG